MNMKELWAVGRLHWRYFLLSWLYPMFLYLLLVALSRTSPVSGSTLPWLLLGAITLFVVSILVASVPYRRRKITRGQAFVWILLIPSIVLLVISQIPFNLPLTVTHIPTQP
jgi:peptidoglycan/LPS O-acetylase OafA/YrhL